MRVSDGCDAPVMNPPGGCPFRRKNRSAPPTVRWRGLRLVAPETISRSMGLRDWGRLLALSALWGGSFFFVGVAVRELPPLTIVTLRVGIAALVLLAVVRAAGLTMPTGRAAWAAFLGMGLLNNVVPFCLIVWGQGHIASSLASILNEDTI
jgi:hypothetical protein